MKMPFAKREKRMVLSQEQKEIIEWVYHHKRETAYETLQLLLQEREAKQPDRAVLFYDQLTTEQKTDIELIIARYFSFYRDNVKLSLDEIFQKITYREK